jgi:hypothetical protein
MAEVKNNTFCISGIRRIPDMAEVKTISHQRFI